MTDEADAGMQRVAALIETYLARHPAAADSEQGIAQWWMPATGADVPIETVRAALEWLVRRGAVHRTVVPGGPAIYRAGTGGPRSGAENNGG